MATSNSKFAAALVLAWCVVGCSKDSKPAPPYDPIRGTPTPAADLQPVYPHIALAPGLEQELVLVKSEGPVEVPGDGKVPLSVRVPLRSTADRDLIVQYRFMFYGPAKEALSDNPVWHSATISPRARQWFSANALALRAQDWDLEVRYYRP